MVELLLPNGKIVHIPQIEDLPKVLEVPENSQITVLPAQKVTGRKLFGGKSGPIKVMDKETGKVYESKSKAGVALASLVKGDPKDKFVWYKILGQFPNRFIETA